MKKCRKYPALNEGARPKISYYNNVCAKHFMNANLGFDYTGVWLHLDMAFPVEQSIRFLTFQLSLFKNSQKSYTVLYCKGHVHMKTNSWIIKAQIGIAPYL